MIDSTEARKGVVIDLEGHLYYVLDYQHIKMGRGSAQVRHKLRDIAAGHTIERTFQSGDRFPRVHLEERPAQYLYQDGDLYYFMDQESFDQFPLSSEMLGQTLNYLKEGTTVQITTHDGQPLGVELPITVELKVVDAAPSFKGNTAQAGGKPATLETGITVQVPFFVEIGAIIRIDTRSGAYLERVS